MSLKKVPFNMSLRSLFLFSFITVAVISVSLFYFFSNKTINSNLIELEHKELENQSKVIMGDVYDLCDNVKAIATDYGIWNEAYFKAGQMDKAYFKENYVDWLSENQSIQLILVLDAHKRTLAEYGPNADKLQRDGWVISAIENGIDRRNGKLQAINESGLIEFNGQLYAVGICPIVHQSMDLPPNGIVIIGKKIDQTLLSSLEKRYGYELGLQIDETVIGDVPTAKLTGNNIRKDKHSFLEYELKDPLNKKVADLVIGNSTDKYKIVYKSMSKYALLGSTIILLIILSLCFFLNRFITYPLFRMRKMIAEMMESGNLKTIDIKSICEIRMLINTFNSLIETIHRREEDIETKDKFIAMISHEFKTPITIINAAIQTMNIVCKDAISNKMKSYVDKISRNSLRQLRLVDNLLDIAKIKSDNIKIHKKNIDIVLISREIIESARLYADQKNIKLIFLSNYKRGLVKIDEEIYERILLNLLSNAIKFTPANKSIHINLNISDSQISLEVIDEGIGIPIDKQELIFKKFGQVNNSLSRQAEGSGIGLYIVKSLVDALGGEIRLESNEGAGAKFTALLPSESDSIESTSINKDNIDYITSLEFSDIII